MIVLEYNKCQGQLLHYQGGYYLILQYNNNYQGIITVQLSTTVRTPACQFQVPSTTNRLPDGIQPVTVEPITREWHPEQQAVEEEGKRAASWDEPGREGSGLCYRVYTISMKR